MTVIDGLVDRGCTRSHAVALVSWCVDRNLLTGPLASTEADARNKS
jgi:hypothetical protein